MKEKNTILSGLESQNRLEKSPSKVTPSKIGDLTTSDQYFTKTTELTTPEKKELADLESIFIFATDASSALISADPEDAAFIVDEAKFVLSEIISSYANSGNLAKINLLSKKIAELIAIKEEEIGKSGWLGRGRKLKNFQTELTNSLKDIDEELNAAGLDINFKNKVEEWQKNSKGKYETETLQEYGDSIKGWQIVKKATLATAGENPQELKLIYNSPFIRIYFYVSHIVAGILQSPNYKDYSALFKKASALMKDYSHLKGQGKKLKELQRSSVASECDDFQIAPMWNISSPAELVVMADLVKTAIEDAAKEERKDDEQMQELDAQERLFDLFMEVPLNIANERFFKPNTSEGRQAFKYYLKRRLLNDKEDFIEDFLKTKKTELKKSEVLKEFLYELITDTENFAQLLLNIYGNSETAVILKELILYGLNNNVLNLNPENADGATNLKRLLKISQINQNFALAGLEIYEAILKKYVFCEGIPADEREYVLHTICMKWQAKIENFALDLAKKASKKILNDLNKMESAPEIENKGIPASLKKQINKNFLLGKVNAGEENTAFILKTFGDRFSVTNESFASVNWVEERMKAAILSADISELYELGDDSLPKLNENIAPEKNSLWSILGIKSVNFKTIENNGEIVGVRPIVTTADGFVFENISMDIKTLDCNLEGNSFQDWMLSVFKMAIYENFLNANPNFANKEYEPLLKTEIKRALGIEVDHEIFVGEIIPKDEKVSESDEFAAPQATPPVMDLVIKKEAVKAIEPPAQAFLSENAFQAMYFLESLKDLLNFEGSLENYLDLRDQLRASLTAGVKRREVKDGGVIYNVPASNKLSCLASKVELYHPEDSYRNLHLLLSQLENPNNSSINPLEISGYAPHHYIVKFTFKDNDGIEYPLYAGLEPIISNENRQKMTFKLCVYGLSEIDELPDNQQKIFAMMEMLALQAYIHHCFSDEYSMDLIGERGQSKRTNFAQNRESNGEDFESGAKKTKQYIIYGLQDPAVIKAEIWKIIEGMEGLLDGKELLSGKEINSELKQRLIDKILNSNAPMEELAVYGDALTERILFDSKRLEKYSSSEIYGRNLRAYFPLFDGKNTENPFDKIEKLQTALEKERFAYLQEDIPSGHPLLDNLKLKGPVKSDELIEKICTNNEIETALSLIFDAQKNNEGRVSNPLIIFNKKIVEKIAEQGLPFGIKAEDVKDLNRKKELTTISVKAFVYSLYQQFKNRGLTLAELIITLSKSPLIAESSWRFSQSGITSYLLPMHRKKDLKNIEADESYAAIYEEWVKNADTEEVIMIIEGLTKLKIINSKQECIRASAQAERSKLLEEIATMRRENHHPNSALEAISCQASTQLWALYAVKSSEGESNYYHAPLKTIPKTENSVNIMKLMSVDEAEKVKSGEYNDFENPEQRFNSGQILRLVKEGFLKVEEGKTPKGENIRTYEVNGEIIGKKLLIVNQERGLRQFSSPSEPVSGLDLSLEKIRKEFAADLTENDLERFELKKEFFVKAKGKNVSKEELEDFENQFWKNEALFWLMDEKAKIRYLEKESESLNKKNENNELDYIREQLLVLNAEKIDVINKMIAKIAEKNLADEIITEACKKCLGVGRSSFASKDNFEAVGAYENKF